MSTIKPADHSKVKMVIFDNNGTMFDDLPMAYGSVGAIFKHYGLNVPTLEEYRNGTESDFMRFYRRYGFYAFPNVTGDDLNAIRRAYYLEHRGEAKYYPEVRPVLLTLKQLGLILAVVSSEIQATLMESLAAAQLRDYFEVVHGAAWPKAPALCERLYQFSLMGSEAVYVDDQVDGIEAAKSLGMRTIGMVGPGAYCSPERIIAALPTATAANFLELTGLITDMM